jgi:hypothetical protein
MTVKEFWDMFEEELLISIQRDPKGYHILDNETPKEYAYKTRWHMQNSATQMDGSLSRACLNTPTFKRLAKRIGVTKFSQKRLIEAYIAMGGK